MFKAVLFDCDGVLVDSEPITLGVLTKCLNASGWAISFDECITHFLGRAVKDQSHLFKKMTGKELTDDWLTSFRFDRDQALSRELTAINGIHEAVSFMHGHFQSKIACASGADRVKIELQLTKVNLIEWFEGRIFSGHEMPKTKPAPDVYLAAAAHLQVEPKDCLVIEDTPTGVTAGVAAGATVWAYLPLLNSQKISEIELLNAGAKKIFRNMHELPGFLIS